MALVVAAKELRQRLRDRTAILLAFVAPSVIAVIVTGAFGSGFGAGNFHDNVALVDLDHSRLSGTFADVVHSRGLRSLMTVRVVASAGAAKRLVADGKVGYAFVVPSGFDRAVGAGGRAHIQVIRNAAREISGEIGQAVASAFTDQVNATRLAIFTVARRTGTAPTAEVIADAVSRRIPVRLEDVNTAPARRITGANYFAPGMAIFFLFFTVGAGARSLLAEKEQGTMPRVLAAPARRWNLVAGKALAMFVLGAASMVTVFLVTGKLFNVDWGDPVALGALTLAILLAVMAVTALVQTMARTEQQAANYGSIVGLVFALFGGNFFPLYQLPKLVQRVSALTPNGWALRGFTDIAYDGAHVGNLVPNLLAISAFVVVCGTIAAVRASRITLR